MTSALKSLKDKFFDLYNLLLKNQGENGLIFFNPSLRFYSVESLDDKTFFYSHIFKRSIYDPSLYVNFLGKVMKSIDDKKFVAELGFKNRFEINVKSTQYNEDSILTYAIDGICTDGQNKLDIVEEKPSESDFNFKRCNSSKEYIEYYSSDKLKNEQKYKKFMKEKANMEKFIYAMKNNNILMKENEEAYGEVFRNSIDKLIHFFSKFFNNGDNNNDNTSKVAAVEFVDSFVFKDLYDDIMNKFKEFYKEEEIEIKKKLSENLTMNKFGLDELKLPNSMANCNFSLVNKNLSNLNMYRTCFEKKKFLIEINDLILNEAKDTYKKATGKELEIQADFMLSCWIYVLAHSGVDNLISEALFFETLLIKEKGKDEFIVNNFVLAVKYIKDELLKNERDINVFMVKPFVVMTEE